MLEGKKVLIIEDEQKLLESYKFKIENRDEFTQIKAFFADNVFVAKDIIEKEKPDLIFLDLSLGESPQPLGLMLLHEYAKKFNIIVISGYSEHMAGCLLEGAKGFLVKSTPEAEFMKMMEKGEMVLQTQGVLKQKE